MARHTKIAYEPHPVTPERKKELRAQGFRIVDARFAPPDARPAPMVAPASVTELPPPPAPASTPAPAAKPQLGLPKNKA